MKKKNTWFVPHILNEYNIEKVVQDEVPGVYMLGNVTSQRKFQIKQLHSAVHIKDELKKALGKYHAFMYKPIAAELRHLVTNPSSINMLTT